MNYENIVSTLKENDPNLRFRKARRVAWEGGRCRRINRAGLVYYVKESYRILNPASSPLGCGLQIVKAGQSDPTGIFYSDQPVAAENEEIEAILAYLFEFGRPRSDIHVIPATCWPGCYSRTPANIEALRQAGAPLPHESLSTE